MPAMLVQSQMHKTRTHPSIVKGPEYANVHWLAKKKPEHASGEMHMIRIGAFGFFRFESDVPALLVGNEEDLTVGSPESPQPNVDIVIGDDARIVFGKLEKDRQFPSPESEWRHPQHWRFICRGSPFVTVKYRGGAAR